jgi:hypothetical protein
LHTTVANTAEPATNNRVAKTATAAGQKQKADAALPLVKQVAKTPQAIAASVAFTKVAASPVKAAAPASPKHQQAAAAPKLVKSPASHWSKRNRDATPDLKGKVILQEVGILFPFNQGFCYYFYYSRLFHLFPYFILSNLVMCVVHVTSSLCI